MDVSIPMHMNSFIHSFIGLTMKIAVILPFAPLLFFLPLGVIVLGAGVLVGYVYMKAQMAVKRELAIAKAPILHVLAGTMSGLGTSTIHFVF
jgi:uncharacterized membrane protein